MPETIGLEYETSVVDKRTTTETGAAVLEASSGVDDVCSSFAPYPSAHRSTLDSDWHGGVSSTFGGFCS